ncbi:DUF6584 family protein [Streptomyces sp. NPDC057539]|uniref:DUF6584 family protein n=1 Tax=Streptomyces sp. NPDC057539 TaxID=3346159 RepID=UPI0036923676
MPRDMTLRAAATEVATGDLASTLRARQRLHGLLGSYPQDLEVREQLAAIYRQLGETAQAGRWNYLSENPDPTETAAFELLFPHHDERLWALRWGGRAEDALTSVAVSRLSELHAEAERDRGSTVPYARPRPSSDEDESQESPLVGALAFVGCLTVLVLVVIGFITVIAALLD